ncbi:hypothetical protein G2W53_035082 [Senna tora]|uniref:SWIM-type domain-containing protein n=1 Tax=Senna tora TaxID=362788 RepID=A0A834W8W8_9FABA|nr:hypothetical protein G2W53_035082 [Senna tora]
MGGMRFEDDDNVKYHSESPDHWPLSEDERETTEVVVDIGAATCSCNSWDIIRIPCEHPVACLAYNKLKAEDYVDQYYSVET